MAFHRLTRTAAALAIVALFAAPAAPQTRRAMTIDDVLDLAQVTAPRISPDGTRVLYTVSELGKWKDNKRVNAIWMANADGTGARRFLGHERDRNPAWSPDGRFVAFLASRDAASSGSPGAAAGSGAGDAGSQIWIIRSDGGEATALTSHKGAIRAFEWAKDGASIVFTAEPEKTDAVKALDKSGDDPIVVDEGANGQERAEFTALWRVPVSGGSEQRISRDDHLLIDDFQMSPDGTRVAVICRRENARNGQYTAEVAVMNAATGALTTITSNKAPEQNVQWSPDGTTLSYLAASDASWELAESRIWIVPASGGTPKRLMDGFSGSVRQYAWAPDGRSILIGAQTRARGAAYRVAVPAGTYTTIASGEFSGAMESMSANGGRGVAIVSSPSTPAEVNVIDLASGKQTAVTSINAQAASRFALSQFRPITWKSRDGLVIEGLLWLPADYRPGTKLPLLLSVHGGPAGAWDLSFRAINHVYTSLGWAVLEPNVRGSSSYGDALLRGNMRDIGGGDYFDLMSGVDTLIADGVADPAQLAIRGWSYGGILGGWTLTQTSRFKAASLGAMVADWTSEYAMGFNHDVRLWYIGGTPWENPERYRQQSSYTHISAVTTPTLLLHGERDTTDTIGQSMMYYQGLKDRNVPVRFIRFPREPHGFREPHHQRIRDAEEIAWLMKYARGVDWHAPERKDPDTATPRKPTEQ